MTRLRHAWFVLLERALLWALVPQLRARLLRVLGAEVGRNVRVYEVRFFNLEHGFRNLVLRDDVHLGHGALVDLTDRVEIGPGAVVSPRCVLLTHTNAGDAHGSEMCRYIPTESAPCILGAEAYLGVGVTVLAGVHVAPMTAVAAGAVVTESTVGREVRGGVPARHLKWLDEGQPSSSDSQ